MDVIQFYVGYDKDLMRLLDNAKGLMGDNNFIVLHLFGSHTQYHERYPESWEVWHEKTNEATYANTILYTDEFLRDVFEYAKENLNLQVMLYFSDHGENLEKGHHPSLRTFDNARIPFFVYMSPEYQEKMPDVFQNLKAHQNEYYTNDMMFNTISGILGAHSNHYDAKEDISSVEYSYNRENTLTFGGTVQVATDKDGY